MFVISGPSGTGKGAICAGIVASEKVAISVSMTTRGPRPHEIDGKNYYFVDKEYFGEALAEGGFFEYAEIYGEYYGTPKKPVLEMLEKGTDVILEIDVKGAKQIKENMPEAILVFIIPPSAEELRRRIEGRGTETAERIARRLERSDSEIAQVGNYDYCVVNDDLEKAIRDVSFIIRAERYYANDSEKLYEDDLFMMDVLRRAEELKVGDDREKIIKRYNEGSKE